MNALIVFRDVSLIKQIKARTDRDEILVNLDLLEKKLCKVSSEQELQQLGLGFKQFKGDKFDVYGINLSMNQAAAFSGERIIFSFIDLEKDDNLAFKKTLESNEKASQAMVLNYYCNHNDTNANNDLVNEIYVKTSEVVPMQSYFTAEEITSITSSVTLKSKYDRVMFNEFEKIVKPVLSIDKLNIIEDFVYKNTRPTLVRGVAGSGKTEIIIKIISDITKLYPEKKILYVTMSSDLKSEIEDKFKVNKPANTYFDTLETLIRRINDDGEMVFANYNTFEFFFNDFLSQMGNDIATKLSPFLEKYSTYDIYSEIDGTIFGSMLLDWTRGNTNYLSLEEYLALPKEYKLFSDAELNFVHSLGVNYFKYCEKNGLKLLNQECLKVMYANSASKYDYVLVDEVQDLSEVELRAMYGLVNNRNNILLCGDENLILNPSYFRIDRISNLFELVERKLFTPEPLTSNFRNSLDIIKLINYYNKIRNRFLPSGNIPYVSEDLAKTSYLGNVYNYTGDLVELFNKFLELANAAIIVDDKYYDVLKNDTNIDIRNIYTIEQCKGMEFDNVVLLNLISSRKDVFDKIYKGTNERENTLSYYFNSFYVAITRARFNLIIVEEEDTLMFNDIKTHLGIMNELSNIGSVDFDYDKKAIAFFERGVELVEDEEYVRAKKYFDRCFSAEEFDKINADELNVYMTICDICINEATTGDMAIQFEEMGYYDYAYKFYDKTNNFKKAALMCLLDTENVGKFSVVLKQNNINFFDLYGVDEYYDQKLDEYINNKFKDIKMEQETTKMFISDIKETIDLQEKFVTEV